MQKDIPELLKAGIITPETAEGIRQYYREKAGQSQNRLFIIFGILGAILVGLGVILIIAHNWDEFSRTLKTFFSFLPLLVGQFFCAFTLWRKNDSSAWRESSSAFLFFAVGASISLISQVYHIPGNISVFILTWMLLCLPLVYLLRSSVTSLLYIIGITYWAAETGYWTYPASETYYYWLLLLAVLPHYYLLKKSQPASNFIIFHHWFIPLSITIALGTVSRNHEEFMFIAYISLFCLFYLVGKTNFFQSQKSSGNGYLAIGSAGTISILLALSFTWFWEDLRRMDILFSDAIRSPEFFTALIASLIAGAFFIRFGKYKSVSELNPMELAFLIFIIIFIIGLKAPFAVILVNLLIFTIGIFTIRLGAKKDHLGILNYGLLIITALVICRFFDTDLSFVFRGMLFVGVGLGFFFANSRMLKKRQEHA